jgi:hypothetical protein
MSILKNLHENTGPMPGPSRGTFTASQSPLIPGLFKQHREVRDVLKSGFVPGSPADRAFAALHRVEVWDDPAMSHDDNERMFRATNIGQASRSPNYGYKAEEDARRYDDLKEQVDEEAPEEQVDEEDLTVDELLEHAARCVEYLSMVEDVSAEAVLAAVEHIADETGVDWDDVLGSIVEDYLEGERPSLDGINASLRDAADERMDEVRESIEERKNT